MNTTQNQLRADVDQFSTGRKHRTRRWVSSFKKRPFIDTPRDKDGRGAAAARGARGAPTQLQPTTHGTAATAA